MRHYLSSLARVVLVLVAMGATVLHGQSQAPTLAAPTVFRMTGVLTTPTGEPRTGTVVLVASLYTAQTDTMSLWSEAQTITPDANGRYSILVGSTLENGVPREYFLSGVGRWLGVGVQGETEQPKVMLITVPYALKASDADTLAGRSIGDFVLSGKAGTNGTGGNPVDPVPGTSSYTNALVKYTNFSGATAESLVYEVGGNVGIGAGMTSPTQALSVNGSGYITGTVFMGDGTTGDFRKVGASQTLNFRNSGGGIEMTVDSAGRLGLGTQSPSQRLQVSGSAFIDGTLFVGSGASTDIRKATASTPLNFRSSVGAVEMTLDANGNVGVGTASPAAKLDVAGNINVSGNINAKYQDVAEWVETTAPLEPGTVVIVDPKSSNRVLAASKAYDTRVAGAVSKQPGLILGEAGENKAMVAQSGRVRVKVDARYGAIRVGDLLVTSPTSGYAMRSRPVIVNGIAVHRAGTLLGKALEALPRGKGEILVLLTLQ